MLALLLFALILVGAVPGGRCAEKKDLISYFQPYITVVEEYNSNIFLSPTNERHDFITTIAPGLRVSSLPRSATTGEFWRPPAAEEPEVGFDLDLLPGFVFYARDSSDDYISFLGNLEAWYTVDRRLTFRVRDYAVRSEDPVEEDYAPEALPGETLLGRQRERSIYFRNVIQPSVEYQFGRENRIALNYINNLYRNESRFYEDSTEHYVNPRLDYWFDIRNGISMEYGFTSGSFETNPTLHISVQPEDLGLHGFYLSQAGL
jgi:hypothetical protein